MKATVGKGVEMTNDPLSPKTISIITSKAVSWKQTESEFGYCYRVVYSNGYAASISSLNHKGPADWTVVALRDGKLCCYCNGDDAVFAHLSEGDVVTICNRLSALK